MEEKKELTQDQKDAFERLKSKKDEPGHYANLFFNMLEGADPRLQEMMHHKAAVLMDVANKMGKQIAESEKDPKKKAEMVQNLEKVAVKIHASVNAPPPKDVE